jgi:MFS family permease
VDVTLRERLVVATAAATRFAAGIVMGTGLAYYVGKGGGSDLAVGAVSTAYFLGMMLFAPFWGAVADVTGRRRAVLVATGLGATLSALPLLVADGTWLPVGIRGLYAVFAAGFPPVMLAIASARGGDAGRGRSLGFYNSARGVGFAGGQLAVGALLGLVAPDELYFAIAALSLASTLAAALVADPVPSPTGAPSLGEILAEVRGRLLPAVEDRAHLRRNGLRWLYVALALRNVTVIGVFALLPVYLPGRLGFSEFEMGALLALNPAAQVAFMYLFGRVADARGRTSLITLGIAGSAGFAIVAAGATLPGSHAGRLAVAAAAFLLIAASFSAMTTGALAFIGDVAPPDRESELMGLRSTAKGIGGVAGPILVGGIATVSNYEIAFAAASALAVVATALAASALVEPRRMRASAVAPGDD